MGKMAHPSLSPGRRRKQEAARRRTLLRLGRSHTAPLRRRASLGPRRAARGIAWSPPGSCRHISRNRQLPPPDKKGPALAEPRPQGPDTLISVQSSGRGPKGATGPCSIVSRLGWRPLSRTAIRRGSGCPIDSCGAAAAPPGSHRRFPLPAAAE